MGLMGTAVGMLGALIHQVIDSHEAEMRPGGKSPAGEQEKVRVTPCVRVQDKVPAVN